VVAVRTKDGTEAWRKERPVASCWTTPTIIRGPAGDVLLTTAPRLVIAYDPQTGQERWQAEGSPNEELTASTLPCGEAFVVLAGREGLIALKVGGKGGATKSAPVWTSDVAPPQVASPVGGDGRCYVPGSGELTCVDAATGKEKWNLELDGDFWASPVLAKDRIYAVNRRGRLFIVSTAGQKLDEVRLDAGVDATPAIVEGRIYIRTGNGLLCLGRAQPPSRK
jgi:outer membrane protein assembly factor BamB